MSKHAHGQIVDPVLSRQECPVSADKLLLLCCQVKKSCEQTCTRTDCCSCAVKSRKAVSKHARGQIVAPVLSGQECLVSRHARGQMVAPALLSQEKRKKEKKRLRW